MNPKTSTTLADLIPYQRIPELFPHLYTKKSWKWAAKQRQRNGLSKAFRKVGKSLFVNIKVLAECIDGLKEN